MDDEFEGKKLFTLGQIAKATGKSRTTLINLEHRGVVKFGRIGEQRFGTHETINSIVHHYADVASKSA